MSDYTVFWKNHNEAAGVAGTACDAQHFGIIHPSVNALHDQFIQPHPASRQGFVIRASTYLKLVDASGRHHVFGSEEDLEVVMAASRLDTGDSLLPGRDYAIYLCLIDDGSDETADMVVSLNSTFPNGHTASTSRKIGGFHTLCADAGLIEDHPLSGYLAGDILPASIWDLWHQPSCTPEGMVFIRELDLWVDIYLQSGTGGMTRSAYNATTTNSRAYLDFVDDQAAVGKALLTDEEFQVAAEGSNQQTVVAGAANPVTTGGHLDTAGRRMISNHGLEDCCGACFQWIRGGGWEYGSAGDDTILWSTDWPGDKGQVHRTSGRSGLMAGGDWNTGEASGSRCRHVKHPRSAITLSHAGRGRARSRITH